MIIVVVPKRIKKRMPRLAMFASFLAFMLADQRRVIAKGRNSTRLGAPHSGRHRFDFIHLTKFFSQCRQKGWDEM